MSKADNTITLNLDDYDSDVITFDSTSGQTITIGEIEETGDKRPSHYSQEEGSVECIAVIRQLCKEHQNDPYTDYNRYQAFKYLWRLGKKDDVLIELIKCRQFLDFAIEALEEERGIK